MMQSSMLQFATVLLSAIVFVHFDIPKTALAQVDPPGPSDFFSTPVICDYPNDDAIRSNFMGTYPHETVVFADIGGASSRVERFSFLYRMKGLPDCFPPDYLYKDQRSNRWFLDFFYRYNVIFLRAARGWVYLVSRADGPRESIPGCSFWFQVEFPTLRSTEAVLGIILVNIEDYEDQWIYWAKGEGDQPRQRPRPGGDDDGSGGDGNGNSRGSTENGNESDGSVFNALTGTLSTGLTQLQIGTAGVVSAGLRAGWGAWRAIMGGRQHPSTPAGDPNQRKNQPDPGIKTDVLNLKIGELPDLPSGTDETLTMTAIDPDETSREEDDGIGGILNMDKILGDSNTATSLNLLGRRHRRRSRTTCSGNDWLDDPLHPDFPGYKSMLGRLETAASQASTYGLLYPFVPGDVVTLLITQYEKKFNSQRQSIDYQLDITILDPAGKAIYTQQQIDAPSGREITVDAHLNLLLHVEVADEKNSPISLRYGDPLIMNTVGGVKWDSNDQSQDHRCTTDPAGSWEDKRQIMCLFKD